MTEQRAAYTYLGAVCMVAVAYQLLDLDTVAYAGIFMLVQLAAIIALVVGARRAERARDRVAATWWTLALGLGAWVAGDIVWFAGAEPAPVAAPLIVDLLYMAGQLAITAAIWRTLRSHRTIRDIGRLLDTALISLGLGIPMWLLWIQPALTAATSTPIVRAVGASHAVLVLAGMVLLVRLAIDGVRGERGMPLFITGLGILAVTRLGYAVQVADDAYALGSSLDLGWLLFFGLVGAAALLPTEPHGTRAPDGTRTDRTTIGRGSNRGLLVTLWAMALVSPTVLIVAVMLDLHDDPTTIAAGIGTLAGFTLLTLRVWHLLRQVAAEAEQQSARADEQARVAQQLRDVERMKNAFLSAISHELRTPLTSIRGMSELLAGHHADRLTEARRQEMVGRVAANARRLEDLLLDLLDLDRLLHGALRPQRVPVDVQQVVERLLPAYAGRRIRVGEAPGQVRIDPVMFERILDNLLGNAAKHTPPRTTVWVTFEPLRDAGIRLIVADDGGGIPLRDRERVLDAFTRLDGSDTVPGTGVGLSLVAEFARLHGGRISIDERPGGGARFTVDLPGDAAARRDPGTGPKTGPGADRAADPSADMTADMTADGGGVIGEPAGAGASPDASTGAY